jgi:hypothetical protein
MKVLKHVFSICSHIINIKGEAMKERYHINLVSGGKFSKTSSGKGTKGRKSGGGGTSKKPPIKGGKK